MAINPRDTNSYISAIIEAAQGINPALDMTKGPLAVLAYAVAAVGSQTEEQAYYLQTLYKLSNFDDIDDEDIFALGENFGIDPNRGVPAKGIVYFYTYTPPAPNTTKRVDLGYIISSSDGRFNYQVVSEAELTPETADAYYNAAERRYEIPVSVEAEAVGDDYNLPPGAITTIQTAQSDWDGVINKDYMRQGTDPASKEQFVNIIWNAQQGLSQNSNGKLINILLEMNPTGVDDISLVPSTDYETFKRLHTLNNKIGYDIYLISDSIADGVMTGIANGGETFIVLEKQPVLAVTYVLVDGVSVPFSLVKDVSPEYENSALASDNVVLTTPLQPAQVYEIRYQYYDLIYEAQSAVENGDGLFGADVLTRLAKPIDVFVEGTAYGITASNKDIIRAEIEAFTANYFKDPKNPGTAYQNFITILNPLDYQDAVEAYVNGITSFRLTKFIRTDIAWKDVEILEFDGKTEYPVLSLNSIFEVK